MNIYSLTISEEALMKVLWQLETAFMNEIIDAYPEPKPHQNTISTYLKILKKKGFLSAKKIGRVYQYKVAIHYDTYRRYLLQNLLVNHFDGFSTEMVHFLLQEKMIKSNDLKRILQSNNIDIQELSENDKISDYLAKLIKKSKKKKKKKKKKS